ncbi:hypothetical protein [Hyalangium minutum]|uniref:hypothetical protein n=1 Tax=Hyalangium minutum TaxID=394096 RepID=UPI0012F8242F|nr:hypothetical protein [Hyalangium minutum]
MGEAAQIATFEVNNGELLQTVIRDSKTPPGTQLRTRILALTRQGELKLQSTQATSGSRSFSWSATCASSALSHGYFEVPGLLCSAFLSGATSLAVDARGGVHAATSVSGGSLSCGSNPIAPATYSRFTGACEPVLSPLPAFRNSGMAVDETTLHFAYLAQSSYELFYRSRPLGGRSEWTEERVAGQGNPVYEMRVLLHNGLPHVLVNRTNGEVELYRRDSGAWSRVALPALMTGEPLSARMVDGTLDANGNLVLLVESYQKVFYQRAGGFELIPLPKDGVAAGFGGSVRVDGRGQVHVTYVYDEIGSNPDGLGGYVISGRGIYGVYDGTAWTSYELGPIAYPRIATRDDGPLRVVHGLYKGRHPPLALTEVARDGSLRSELINPEQSGPEGGSPSPDPFYHPTAAVGPDGTIAAAWDGHRVFIRPPDAQFVRERTTITFTFGGTGGGRVRSADGTIDCTSTCTVELPVGSRHQLFFEPDARSVLEQYPGYEPFLSLYGYIWFDVPAGPTTPASIRFRHTPVAAVLPITTANGSTVGVNRFAARDGRVAIIATTNGDISFGGTVATLPSGEVLAVREANGQVWAATVPMTPVAIGIQSNGTTSALFYADRSLSFPSGTVGSNSAPVLVLAHYANGSFQALERLADVPSGTQLMAAAVGNDDTAGLVLSNVNGFGSLGVSAFNLFVYRNSTGSVLFRGLQADAAAAGTAGLALANGRATVALPNPFNTVALSTLTLFQDGAPTGTQTVRGGVLTAIVLGPDRVLSLWHPTEGYLDIGNGYVPFNAQAYFLAEHALDGRPLAATPVSNLDLRAGHFALTSTASGTISVRPSYNAGLEYGRINDPSYFFTYGGDLLGNKATPLMSSADGTSFWVAVRHQGTVNYEITKVGPTYITVVLQLRLP